VVFGSGGLIYLFIYICLEKGGGAHVVAFNLKRERRERI